VYPIIGVFSTFATPIPDPGIHGQLSSDGDLGWGKGGNAVFFFLFFCRVTMSKSPMKQTPDGQPKKKQRANEHGGKEGGKGSCAVECKGNGPLEEKVRE